MKNSENYNRGIFTIQKFLSEKGVIFCPGKSLELPGKNGKFARISNQNLGIGIINLENLGIHEK